MIVIPHALTFPGAFAPTGLLGAGPQSAAYLSISWRFGLSLGLLVYAFLISGKHTKEASESSPRAAIIWSVTIVIVVVGTLTLVVTAGEGFLPSLLSKGAVLPLGHTINGMIALMNMVTLLLLWTRGRSILDLWLMVAVCGLIGEGVFVAFFVTARFTFGFYAVRIISLVVSKVVLIVLLSETLILQARLSIANRKLQRERANRLTSAEAVVAAIAHEVRQPLTSMNTNAGAGRRFLDRTSPDVPEAMRLFGEIQAGAFRANEVFESFLRLFREGKQDRQAVDVNALTLEATRLLRKELDDHNVIARAKLASDLPVVQGHSGQLREVILNLIQNAIDAMASTTNRPRVISIATSRLGSDAISISLQDTGPGIEPQKLASIFDPFVTTKAKGTGLGLAICKMIVDQHSGKLSAASGENGGARFEIMLPTMTAAPSVPVAAS